MDSPTIIFLHLPKTAGTSFNGVLDAMYPNLRQYFATGNGFKQLNGLARLSVKELQGYGIVRGHMNHGAHKLFSSACVYVTFIMDPVSRIVSHYKYLQTNEYHPLYACYHKKHFSLKDFLKITTDNDNGMTRALAGIANALSLFEGEKVPFGKVNRGHLERALENLENNMFFGIQEEFDLSLLYFRRALAWKEYPLYSSRNITPGVGSWNISQSDLDCVVEANRLDVELYEKARVRFFENISPIRKKLDVELPLYKQANMLQFKYELTKTNYDDLELRYAGLQSSYRDVESKLDLVWGKYLHLADSIDSSRVIKLSKFISKKILKNKV